MKDLLRDLNTQQLKAVEICDRNLLIVAGAGSGKTRVLTRKAAYIIAKDYAAPSSILAVTFTNKAAAEMKQRIIDLLGEKYAPKNMGTFHSLAARFLRIYGDKIGYTSSFSIYDEEDQKSLLKACLKEKNIDSKVISPGSLVSLISSLKSRYMDFLDRLKKDTTYYGHQTYEIVHLYQEKLRLNCAMDFGDLLVNFLYILKHYSDVKKDIQRKISHIFVDEYQDTNKIQCDILREIYHQNCKIYAVGDEDQSIYSWRGARVKNMIEFEEHFPNTLVLKLEKNYRSTKKILNLANAVIAPNTVRRDKKLWTDGEEGETPVLAVLDDERAEAEYIVSKIINLTKRGFLLSDCAVFYRTNSQSRAIEEELVRNNVPYQIYGSVRFYERKEIKNMLAYLSLLVNPDDDIALRRIINVPQRGIGHKTIEDISTAASQKGTSMLRWILEAPHIPKKIEKKIESFRSLMKDFIGRSKALAPSQTLDMVMNETGYIAALMDQNDIEGQTRIDNLNELAASMRIYEEENPSMSLEEFLQQISLLTDMDRNNNTNSVKLMTVHSAKGLEFKIVFVAGLEDGLFPHSKSFDDSERLEEERRLFYVAVTRAEKMLFLTMAGYRRSFAGRGWSRPSRFIEDIPDTLLDHYNKSCISQSFSRRKNSSPEDFSSFDPFPDYELAETPTHPYRPGVKVLHPTFGQGIIKRAEGEDDDLKLTVTFKGHGTRKILVRYCKMEILS